MAHGKDAPGSCPSASSAKAFLGLPPTNLYATPINEIAAYENLNSHPEAVEALMSLVDEFQTELQNLGVNILPVKQQMFLHHPFGRVPLNDPAYAEIDAVYRVISVPYDEYDYPISRHASPYELGRTWTETFFFWSNQGYHPEISVWANPYQR